MAHAAQIGGHRRPRVARMPRGARLCWSTASSCLPHPSRKARTMKIVALETIPVSVPYTHVERSSRVKRGGVSDVIVKLTTDTGLVGWGESCCGADTASIEAAVQGDAPLRRRPRSVGHRGDRPRRLQGRPVGFPRRHGELRLRRHRHGALGSVRQGLRRSRSTACSAAPCATRSTTSTTSPSARPRSSPTQCRDGVAAATAAST